MAVYTDNQYKDTAKQYGIDPKGNNPAGTIYRRLAVNLAPSFFAQSDFYNRLQPEREKAVMNSLKAFSPGGMQNLANSYRTRAIGQGIESGNALAGQLQGIGAQEGARIQQYNQALRGANDYQRYLYSPEGMQAMSNLYMNLTKQGVDLPTLLGLGNAIEGRHQQNVQDRAGAGFAGVANQIGGFLGGYQLPTGRPSSYNPAQDLGVIWNTA